jgi:hypothetical protein
VPVINFEIFEAGFHSVRAFQSRPIPAIRLLLWSFLPALIFVLSGTVSAAIAPEGGLVVSGLQLVILLSLLASVHTAYLRFLVDGDVYDGIPFRFGGLEVKLLGTLVYWTALALTGFILFFFVALPLLGGPNMTSFAFLGMLLIPGQFWISVRTCPVLAMSYLDRKVVRLDVWPATYGIFWQTLLSLLLVGLVLWTINLVLGILFQDVNAPSEVLSFPLSLLAVFLGFALTGFLLGPGAYIAIRVRDIRSDPSLDPPSA